MSGPFVLVRSTYGAESDARTAARQLVAGGLACCAHVTRIESVYRWEGQIVEEAEWMLEVRVLSPNAEAARESLLASHPYDEPLVEELVVQWAAPGYVAWAQGERK